MGRPFNPLAQSALERQTDQRQRLIIVLFIAAGFLLVRLVLSAVIILRCTQGGLLMISWAFLPVSVSLTATGGQQGDQACSSAEPDEALHGSWQVLGKPTLATEPGRSSHHGGNLSPLSLLRASPV